MEQNIDSHKANNELISKLVSDMKEVSLNKLDIYSVILELFNDFTADPKTQLLFDKFWNKANFIEFVSEQGQMSIVAGIQSVTLNENIPFEQLIDVYFNDKDLDRKLISISLNIKDRNNIKEFVFYFRKELFLNVFYSNLKLQEITLIDKKVLNERLSCFNRKNTYEKV